jgi:hypothetical protein
MITAGVANGLLLNENPLVVPNGRMTLTVARFSPSLVPSSLYVGGPNALLPGAAGSAGFRVSPSLFAGFNLSSEVVFDLAFL